MLYYLYYEWISDLIQKEENYADLCRCKRGTGWKWLF